MEDGESENRNTYSIFTDDNEQSVEDSFNNTRAHTLTPSWSVKAQSTDKGNEGMGDPLSTTMNTECMKSELGYHGIDLPAHEVPYSSPAQIVAQEPVPVPPLADAAMTSEEARSTVEPRISASQRGGPSSDKVYCLSRLHDHLIPDYVPDFDQLYPQFIKCGSPEECDKITSEHSKSVPVVADDSDEAKELFRDHWNPTACWRWLVMLGLVEDCAGPPIDPVANALESEDE